MKFEKYIYKKNIKNLPKELLPREKALKYGIDKLSDIELLALSLGQGTKELNVLGLASLILKDKSLKDLKEISLEELLKIKGIGTAKALQILSIIEIAKRIEEEDEKITVNKPSDVYNLVKFLHKEKQEKLIGIYTNLQNQVLGIKTVAIGSLNIISIKPRDIFVHALELNAYGIILAHNHPEGSCEPSEEDIEFTKNLQELALKLGFELLDHIIVGKKDYISLANKGII